jgi:subtilisin family serine protease
LGDGYSEPKYYIGKFSGTSMAGPMVTGVLACALEIYPEMSQTQAKSYIMGTAGINKLIELNEIHSRSYGLVLTTTLGGGPNRLLHYKLERTDDGISYPKQDYRERPKNTVVYPRVTRVRK